MIQYCDYRRLRFKPTYAVRLFSLAAFFFLIGCTGTATPVVQPPEIISTEMVPAASKVPITTPTIETDMTESTPHVSPYIKVMVVNVEIRFLETDPVQVELVIRGILPDQCKYEFYSVETRSDRNIKVSLDGIHPADTSCPQTAQNIEYLLRLGRDRPEADRGFAPGDYKLTVNNYQTTISVKQ